MEHYTVDLQKQKKVLRKGYAAYLFRLDSVKKDELWGRLRVEGRFLEFPEKGIMSIYLVSTNEQQNIRQDEINTSRVLMENRKGPFVNQRDILLYGLRGRYLWVSMEIPEDCAFLLEYIRVYHSGDRFLHTFPEVYQEKEGGFHRYLSIFSTLYDQFQEQMECSGDLLDIDKTPQGLLTTIGDWLGIDCRGGGLQEARLRELLRWGYRLNRLKGTRAVIARITEIILEETPIIIEKEPEKVVLLLHQELTEQKELLLLFYLNQFKTAQSKLHIVSFQDVMGIDEYCYMDVNAEMSILPQGMLDGESALEQSVM